MPQFDFYSFPSQVFWSLLGFLIFYFFILRFYLVNFSETFKMRSKLISFYVKTSKTAISLIDILSTFSIRSIF